MDNDQEPVPGAAPIERPDITVAQIVLLILSQKGKLPYRSIISHPLTALLAATRTGNSYYTALARLKSRRQVTRTGEFYELTPHGEFAALKALVRKELVLEERGNESPPKSKEAIAKTKKNKTAKTTQWDGKWRIVLFDVPESKRPIRDYLRGVLKRAGCHPLMRSMWISPHKLPSYIQRILEDATYRRYARMITTTDIDYDEDLRKRFRLI